MFEVSESQYKPVEWRETVTLGGRTFPAIVAATIQGALNTKLIKRTDQIVSVYHRRCASCRPPCQLDTACVYARAAPP